MRQLWLLVALAGGGCNSILGIHQLSVTDAPPGTEIDAPPLVDAMVDAGPDAENEECFGSTSVAQVCFAPTMHPPLTLPTTINTDTGCARVLTQTDGPAICVFIGQSITVPSAGTTVSGTRALMLAASGSITVDGDLEVGSVEAGRVGPAANPVAPACVAPSAGGNSNNEGGGGGAGGSFGSLGANGADGSDGGGAGNAGTAGSVPATIVGLRGGCPGSLGGRGDGAAVTDPGTAGSGGGAVYLVAGTTITITAQIDASGAGGGGADGNKSGGGGGGSGGMIILEAATTITLSGSGEVFANGGGGGEGTITGGAADGQESTAYNDAGNAGVGGGGGGDGGAGAFQAVLAGVGQVAGGPPGTEAGGGAGGGGLGVIRTKGMVTGGNANRFSPTRQALDN